MRPHALAWPLVLATTLGACSGSPQSPVPKSASIPTAATPTAATSTTAVAKAEAEPPAPVKWDPRGRRDPFEPPASLEGAAGMTVASAKLTGIVRGNGNSLALVETSDGLGYILKPGDTLADGRLVEIGASSVVFSVVPRPGSTSNRVVLRLAGD
jgi:hypothetical protein